MNCPRCGAFHQPGAATCTACGAPLSGYPQAAPSAHGAPPAGYAQAAPSAYGAPPAGYPSAAPPYGAPPAAPPYGAPPSYGAPSAAPPYGAPPAYGAPPPYPPGAYGSQPGGPGPYDAAPYPYAAPKTSGLAIVGFIFSFLCSFIGLVLSIIALVRIGGSQGALRGKSLAIAGIILSAIFLVVGIAYRLGQ